ncbi:hypothetical protein HY643_03130 [Candidatus Woesearchaeota archaeon]|nr:hypothetical protein [Candidatus Woesearchaeota archaeon]
MIKINNITKLSMLIIILALGIFLAGCGSNKNKETGNAVAVGGENDLVIHRSNSCGCCTVYAGYMLKQDDLGVEVMEMSEVDSVKKDYGVPSALQSCHTSILGNYFIEGHVPVEAIRKLMTEKPDIKGIALPGMPSGAPGMTGGKSGDLVVYAVKKDGSYEPYMTF